MTFPVSPTDGQQTTINGTIYVYNASKSAWVKLSNAGVPITANTLVLTATTNSTNPLTGALLVAGGVGVEKSVTIGQNATVYGDLSANTIQSNVFVGSINVSNGFNVTGNVGVTNNLTVGGDATVTGDVDISGNARIGNFYSNFTRVTINFGSTPVYNKTVYVTDIRAQVGTKVVATPSAFTTDEKVILGNDDLEFDNFMCTANVVSSGNIALYITSYPGPVKGQRNFEYILG